MWVTGTHGQQENAGRFQNAQSAPSVGSQHSQLATALTGLLAGAGVKEATW
jgi:hypothetical protein